MIGKASILAIIFVICNGASDVTHEVNPGVTRSTGSKVILVCLGGAEERAMTSSIASLLSFHGYHVLLFTYGGGDAGGGAGGGGGGGVEVINIPLAEADRLYAPIGQPRRYIVPSRRESGLFDVTSPGEEESANQSPPLSYDVIMTSSIRHACKQTLDNTTWTKDQISRAKIFATPLHFHDLCTLTFAAQFDLPIVGLVTSPTGAWWSWYHLDLVPPLATNAVPPNIMSANFGFFERLWNILNFYSYITKMDSHWLNPLVTSLPDSTFKPITELYRRVGAIVAAYDWLVYPDLPVTPFVTSLAGARWGEDPEIEKDMLAAITGNRNGAVILSLTMEELWVGAAAQDAILDALATTPFTVVWRGVGEARGGVEEVNNTRGGAAAGKSAAIFVQKEDLPMRALLGHPRHRLLLSLCGLQEVALGVVYGSPVLCVPVTPDQTISADRLADLGVALVVPAAEVTTTNIREAVRNMTTNRSYRARGRQMAEEYLAQPLDASDRVLHAFDKLVRWPWRYKRRDTHGLSPLAQSNGDVTAAMFVLMTSLGLVVVTYGITILWRLFVERRKEEEEEEEERKRKEE